MSEPKSATEYLDEGFGTREEKQYHYPGDDCVIERKAKFKEAARSYQERYNAASPLERVDGTLASSSERQRIYRLDLALATSDASTRVVNTVMAFAHTSQGGAEGSFHCWNEWPNGVMPDCGLCQAIAEYHRQRVVVTESAYLPREFDWPVFTTYWALMLIVGAALGYMLARVL